MQKKPNSTPKITPSVLLLTHSLGLEGAPRIFTTLAKGLLHSAKLVVFSHVDGPLRDELELAGIKVFIAHRCTLTLSQKMTGLERYCRNNLTFLDFSTLQAWKESVKMTADSLQCKLGYIPDVILSNTILGFWGVELGRIWKRPVVWCIHESEPPFSHLKWLPPKLFTMLPALLQAAAKVVFVAKATEKLFQDAGLVFNSTVIPCGLSMDMPALRARFLDRGSARQALNIIGDRVCLLLVGSVFERKGQIDICRALALLPDTVLQKLCCHIVGDRPGTPYSHVLHRCIKQLPIQAQSVIRVFQETINTALHYKSADIFILCSREESYPLVILEAMHLGLPIITTPVFGIKEQLTHESALFYNPGDIKKLSEHIKNLIQDVSLRKKMGEASFIRYSRLPDYDDMCNSYTNIINSLAANVEYYNDEKIKAQE